MLGDSPLQIMTTTAPVRFSRSSRFMQAGQVTLRPGGSAQAEPGPGSSAQSDIRQYGVTAW